jgi:hypothetical protein
MKIIDIKKTERTPEITLDAKEKIFEIKGKCLPENIVDFDAMVTEKLRVYLTECFENQNDCAEGNPFKVNLKLAYFNSAAAKFIADILMLVNEFIKKEKNIKIYWYFQEEDDDMQEAGEEFTEMLEIPMNFVMVSRENSED